MTSGMGVRVRFGRAAELELLDEVPESLLAVADLWADDPRRLPALLHASFAVPLGPYVACWPRDAPPPDPSAPPADGVVLTEATTIRCFVCGARFAALYPDYGMSEWDGDHPHVSGCPACGADFLRSRVGAYVLRPVPL